MKDVYHRLFSGVNRILLQNEKHGERVENGTRFSDILPGLEHVYSGGRPQKHQTEVLEEFLQDLDIGVLWPVNTGRRDTFLIGSFLQIYTRPFQNVLYLTPSFDSARAAYDRSKEIRQHLFRNTDVDVDEMLSVSILDRSDRRPELRSDLIITTPEYLSSNLLPSISRREKRLHFLSGLGRVVFEDVTRFSGFPSSHLKLTLRRLDRVLSETFGRTLLDRARGKGSPVRVTYSAQPFRNLDEFLRFVFGREIFQSTTNDAFVQHRDVSRKKPEIELIVPEGKASIAGEAGGTLELDRAHVLDTLEELLEEILPGSSHVLICSYAEQITEADSRRLERKTETSQSKNQLTIVPSVQSVRDRQNRNVDDVDQIILIGFNGGEQQLAHEISCVGNEHVEALLLASPWLRAFPRLPDRSIREEPLPYLPVPEGNRDDLVLRHMLGALCDHPSSLKSIQSTFHHSSRNTLVRMANLFGLETSRLSSILEEAPEFILSDSEDQRIEELITDRTSNFYFDSSEAEPREIRERDGDSLIGTMDGQDEKALVINQNIPLNIQSTAYVLSSEPESGVVSAAEKSDVGTAQLLKQTTILSGEMNDTFYAEHMDVEYGTTELTLREELQKFIHFTGDQTTPSPTEVSEHTDRTVETTGYFLCPGGDRYDGDLDNTSLHIFGHLVLKAVHRLISTDPDKLGLVHTYEPEDGKNGILVYETTPYSTGIVNKLLDLNPERLLVKAYEILNGCGCDRGCFGCVKYVHCQDPSYNGNLSRNKAGRILKNALKGTDREGPVRKALQLEEGELKSTVSSREELRRGPVRWALDFLGDCGFSIDNVAKVDFMDENTPFYSLRQGFFRPVNPAQENRPSIRLRNDLTVAQLIEVATHEFLHNWQYDSPEGRCVNVHKSLRSFDEEVIDAPENVPFGGKLFIEGLATWAGKKAESYYRFGRYLDGYSPGRQMTEYTAGYEIFRYVEEEYGIRDIREFARSGILPDGPETVEDTKTELMEKTGFQTYLNRVTDRRYGEDDLQCLKGTEYEREPNRVTYLIPTASDLLEHQKRGPAWISELLFSELFEGQREDGRKIDSAGEKLDTLRKTLGYDELPCRDCPSRDRHTPYDLMMVNTSEDCPLKELVEEL